MQSYIKSKQLYLSLRQYTSQLTFINGGVWKKLGCLENEDLENKDPADIKNWENEDPADIEDW